jgi:hypothetical protein
MEASEYHGSIRNLTIFFRLVCIVVACVTLGYAVAICRARVQYENDYYDSGGYTYPLGLTPSISFLLVGNLVSFPAHL